MMKQHSLSPYAQVLNPIQTYQSPANEFHDKRDVIKRMKLICCVVNIFGGIFAVSKIINNNGTRQRAPLTSVTVCGFNYKKIIAHYIAG